MAQVIPGNQRRGLSALSRRAARLRMTICKRDDGETSAPSGTSVSPQRGLDLEPAVERVADVDGDVDQAEHVELLLLSSLCGRGNPEGVDGGLVRTPLGAVNYIGHHCP